MMSSLVAIYEGYYCNFLFQQFLDAACLCCPLSSTEEDQNPRRIVLVKSWKIKEIMEPTRFAWIFLAVQKSKVYTVYL